MSFHPSRRQFLKSSLGLAAASGMLSSASVSAEYSLTPDLRPATDVAKDEKYWQKIAGFYDRTEGVVNLEQGYWGQMSNPVQQAYIDATRMVNQQNAVYARKNFNADFRKATHQVAESLGAKTEEIALTRNATEALQGLVRQYRGLKQGDAVLWADIDYPDFKSTMQWLAQEHKVEGIQIDLPDTASQAELIKIYEDAFNRHPNIRLILLTHVSNQHGLVLPVKEINRIARAKGIDVICDCAQSWGLLDFRITELDVDWAVFNLHKWIGSPVGVGALYMKAGTLEKVAPHPGKQDPDNSRVFTRIHMATANFASFLAVPDALAFHHAVGGQHKETRLKYLRQIWTSTAAKLPSIQVLGGTDAASISGMGAFRLQGKTSAVELNALQQRLEQEFGVFTVVRSGLASGSCIRVTPQVFTTPDDINQLVQALKQIS